MLRRALGATGWWLRDHLGLVLLALVLVPAAVLTALRLTDPSWGPAVRLTSFVPYALPLYAAALVVAGIRHARWRSRVQLVPVVLAAAGLAAHGWWVAPYWLGPNPPAARGADPLVVVTSNLFQGEGDALGLVELASAEEADLLVVNEITGPALRQMRSAGIDDVLPYAVGGPEEDPVVGTMVFSRVPLSEPRRLDTPLASYKVDVGGPGGLTLLAVHPSAPLDAGDWRRDHDTLRRAAVRGGADLVVGDLNATLDHAPLRRLVDAGYRDAVELANAGFQPTWPENGLFGPLSFLPALVQIDHVLVGEDLAARSARAVALGGTDHRAVVAELAPQ
ncbi:endonuclease/exonuclease/phosphatase family protein [Nocardioides sp. SOB77]|uniref:Endonuclease/exonuclease/phosphatase family protein n=1 Tax=Nocardioides oceani TaxID=3058369 RepID=A0ABT8FDH6_9ACTN|nr:endonuclease/exonuclease/phosphatase family protein [Nocardioides oceani]MDN4172723.1 endonuclease/exonuclease/phosphatase family protein [Nocardioides oceani]